ncbi:MAG TPA: NADH:flavin oxidoreductase/NADH oxidase [Kofleriaceae bacterium]|nr:NADH:flavin oxidoreductase/NADH oxidase [Kofleriaceae bacterium]
MSQLFSPLALRDLTLANRIIISPMCQYSAEHGRATPWHTIHLGSLALSGAAMLCTEATAVEPEGRITAADLGLYDDASEAALRPVIAAIRAHSKIALAVQLAHAGRKATCQVPWDGGRQVPSTAGGWRTSAPSPIAFHAGDEPPVALDAAGLGRVRDAFAAAARRADRLGIDAIEIHAAHGYLLHQFLSPLSNQRGDAYGGALAHRMRFPLEVFDAVRAAFPAGKPVGVRVSATDWVDGGWDLEQTIAFARELAARGVDWIDASSGGTSSQQKIAVGPGFQVPFAHAIKEATGVPTMAVGLITEPAQAEAIVAEGKADMVALARAMLYDARWPWHAAAALGAQVEAPPQYWRSTPPGRADLFGHPKGLR